MLTLERATELNNTMVTEEHLILHAKNVSYAMGAMAEHFGENPEHWQAVGMLHDYDYEKYPEEHLQHTKEPLLAAGVDEEDVRAIGQCARETIPLSWERLIPMVLDRYRTVISQYRINHQE